MKWGSWPCTRVEEFEPAAKGRFARENKGLFVGRAYESFLVPVPVSVLVLVLVQVQMQM